MTAAAPSPRPKRRRRRFASFGIAIVVLGVGAVLRAYEPYSSIYEATYVGSARCGACHSVNHDLWDDSSHALMVRAPTVESVVGDFEDAEWLLPPEHRRSAQDALPAARMYRAGNDYYLALRKPGTADYAPFRIDQVVGYKYRQTYLHQEPGGVLRRLPLQWSVERGAYFPYWNLQEGSAPSVDDLWAQMRSQNSAWNLFCARCHVTNLEVLETSFDHSTGHTTWTQPGIACEACHGPGSAHADYFDRNYVNRIAAFAQSKLRGEPVAYIAAAPKMDRGRALSVCARCHGPDIMMASTDVYRRYEPGYEGQGRINDLSPHFKEFPLQPGRRDPTVECWDDGRPKGIGMLFRSFIESACSDDADVRCYDCHEPHANERWVDDGLARASATSDAYCLECHDRLRADPEAHTHHVAGTGGSFCYDCHMPHTIQSIVTGVEHFVRTHEMSSIPDPAASITYGLGGAPNACNECHDDQTPQWAAEWMERWYDE